MSEQLSDLDFIQQRLEEDGAKRNAVRKLREDRLSQAVDEMLSRFNDCAELIVAGKYAYEDAFEFCRKQAERCAVLKNELLPPE